MAALDKKDTGIGRKPALLVVDASVGFTDPHCALGAEVGPEVAGIAKLLAQFRAQRLPVYFTTVVYDKPEQASVFRAKLPALNLLRRGSNLVDIDPRLAPRAGETLIEKHWPSAFFETDLAQRMRRAGVDTVFVCGFSTSGCVRASAVDSLSSDFRTVVVSDACADRDGPAHKANLYDLAAKYADVVKLAEALALLERATV